MNTHMHEHTHARTHTCMNTQEMRDPSHPVCYRWSERTHTHKHTLTHTHTHTHWNVCTDALKDTKSILIIGEFFFKSNSADLSFSLSLSLSLALLKIGRASC